ncbi:MAG: efflux RND transporter periplasmic adaptor subunit [Bacteroidales bacterium]|nr:efflux RND transporter periplasmic adaptor subunit [Bacteroidales bacterium]
MRHFINLLSIFLLLLPAYACNRGKNDEGKTEPVKVKIIDIRKSAAIRNDNYIGTVKALTSTSISFLVPGTVNSVKVAEGEYVKKGQILAELDSTTLKSAREAAASALARAKDAYKRYEMLHNNGSLADIKWEEVKNALAQAASAYKIAKRNLNNTVLKAPSDGYISKRDLEPGETAIPGSLVMTLVDISRVYIEFSVPEKEISSIRKGAELTASVGALDDFPIYGKVTEKGVVANLFSHTYTVKMEIPNKGFKLMPGMICNVNLSGKEGDENITIPNKAIQVNRNGNKFVWVDENGRAAIRQITIGGFAKGEIIVKSGLAPGDKIITEGQEKISEGMEITSGIN